MKIEIVCPCCNEKLQVDIPFDAIDDKNNIDDQAILEQELLDKYNILLG